MSQDLYQLAIDGRTMCEENWTDLQEACKAVSTACNVLSAAQVACSLTLCRTVIPGTVISLVETIIEFELRGDGSFETIERNVVMNDFGQYVMVAGGTL